MLVTKAVLTLFVLTISTSWNCGQAHAKPFFGLFDCDSDEYDDDAQPFNDVVNQKTSYGPVFAEGTIGLNNVQKRGGYDSTSGDYGRRRFNGYDLFGRRPRNAASSSVTNQETVYDVMESNGNINLNNVQSSRGSHSTGANYERRNFFDYLFGRPRYQPSNSVTNQKTLFSDMIANGDINVSNLQSSGRSRSMRDRPFNSKTNQYTEFGPMLSGYGDINVENDQHSD